MQFLNSLLFLLIVSVNSFGQRILSGDYVSGLKLAFNPQHNLLTGFFESYTGWDEDSKSPRFSCIFYIEGTVNENNLRIKTYYPGEENKENIEGELEIIDNKTVKIKLPEEHGGCWNVQHFSEEPVTFQLNTQEKWIQISYVESTKAYFYSDKALDKKQKTYLIKNDIVCIEKIEGEWAYCTFSGKIIQKGWIKIENLKIK